MSKFLYSYFSALPSVYIDGILYVCVGLFTFLLGAFSSDEAAKWISPQILYWFKLSVGSVSCIALNIKMYRSTGFSDHLKEKNEEKKKQETQPPFKVEGQV